METTEQQLHQLEIIKLKNIGVIDLRDEMSNRQFSKLRID